MDILRSLKDEKLTFHVNIFPNLRIDNFGYHVTMHHRPSSSFPIWNLQHHFAGTRSARAPKVEVKDSESASIEAMNTDREDRHTSRLCSEPHWPALHQTRLDCIHKLLLFVNVRFVVRL